MIVFGPGIRPRRPSPELSLSPGVPAHGQIFRKFMKKVLTSLICMGSWVCEGTKMAGPVGPRRRTQ